ncbi:MAG: hypothetical protein KF746_22580 [Chitinophagaceae bacterium]|nr:hypothetical protein [Chitinophagaceae bacterium]
MKLFLPVFVCLVVFTHRTHAQSCTPAGNQTSYGTNNVWRGYVYDNINFTNYRGYVTEGSSGSPNFDQNFGGDDVSYATNGCPVQTSTFSVRYKLRKTFANGTYQFVVGGDDGFRLSFDGGDTWAIDRWNDQSYTTQTYTIALNGSYDMVLEFYENGGANRISFSMAAVCTPSGNPAVYGTGNVWYGYVYDGTNFDTYIGRVTEGFAGNPDFDESFGGSNVTYTTSSCSTPTETFSMRYRLTKNFSGGTYRFIVGGDDGYRLSIDGGSTWLINSWNLQSYTTTTSNTLSLSGSYNLVLEYYENSGDNRVSFALQTLTMLPISVEAFTAAAKDDKVDLSWTVSANSSPRSFEVEKSADGISFKSLGTVPSNVNWAITGYKFSDISVAEGISYYRLKMTDADGVLTYSKVITIHIAVSGNRNIRIYPSIVTGNGFYIKSTRQVRNAVITVTDINGRMLIKQPAGNIAAGQPLQVEASAIAGKKGMYTVAITGSDNNWFAGRIIVQ